MRKWVSRLFALAVTVAAIDAAIAGAHGTATALLCALGAGVLSIIAVALLWNAPEIAAALNVVLLTGAFAAVSVLAGGPGAPGGLAFTATPAGISSAIVYSVAIAVLSLAAALVIRPRAARAAIAVVAVAGILSSIVTFARPQNTAAAAPPSNVAAEASRTETTIDALLARVSNGIRYEIYPGVFRGSAGTLADGAGNDADKAVLLHDLIAASNPNAALRYASCELSAQQSDRLISAAGDAYRPPVILAQAAGRVAGTEKNSKAQALLRRIAGMWDDAASQARDRSARLTSTFQSDGAPVKALAPSDLRAIVAHHIWLQVQRGGQWSDLDPTLPHAVAGASLCSPASTMLTLAPQEFTNVTVLVHAELRSNGAPADRTLLQATWPAAQLAQKTLTFMFAEPAGVNVNSSPVPVPTGMTAYTPVLRAGEAATAGEAIVMPAPAGSDGNISTNSAGAVSAAAAAFGTPTPAPTSTPANTQPDVTGLWLRITVNAPGEDAETVESPIFDRVAYADRAAGRAAQAQLAALDQSEGIYTAMTGVWNIAVNEGTAVAGSGDRKRVDYKTADLASLAAALGDAQRSFFTARRALFASIDSAHTPIDAVRPGVNLAGLTWHSIPGKSATGATLIMDAAADHAAPVGALASDTIAWGVSSLLAERLSTDGPRALSTPRDDRAIGRDVLDVFDWAPKENIVAKIVRSPQDLSGMSIPEDARARIDASLAAGSVAYVPARAVTLDDANTYYGWWTIGADGMVRDEMQNGRHQDMEEEGDTDLWAAKWRRWVEKNGRIVRCVAFGIAVANGAFAEDPLEGAEMVEHQAHAEYELEKEIQEIEEIAESPDDEDVSAECASE